MQVTRKPSPAHTALAKKGIVWLVLRKGLLCCPGVGSDWLPRVMLPSLNRSLRPCLDPTGPYDGGGVVVPRRKIPGCWDWKKGGKPSGSISLRRCLHPRLEAFAFAQVLGARGTLLSPGPLQCLTAFPAPALKALRLPCLLRRPSLMTSELSTDPIITTVSTCVRACAQWMCPKQCSLPGT